MGTLSPNPCLRNFFEKKFLKNLQKTLKGFAAIAVMPSIRRDSGDVFTSPIKTFILLRRA